MKNSLSMIGLCVLIIVCAQADDLAKRYPLIPKPVTLLPASGTFSITSKTSIWISPWTEDTKKVVFFIADFLALATGEICLASRLEMASIQIVIDDSIKHPEAYELSITPEKIHIKAGSAIGAFWAFQTLRQLLPPVAERGLIIKSGAISVPCVTIYDEPRFAYRGLHLDVARHMFSVEFIKKYIDLLSSYKLNTFHWHLTDDQGWRIEIKKYPQLQQVAAYREQTLHGHLYERPHKYDGIAYGGYYTQEEIKEIVAYAAQRQVTIIPEIEMPGHSAAVLAAFPEFACRDARHVTGTKWGVFEDIYCAGNDQVFIFLENVLDEVMALFPSKYIHIGGDEAPKTRWASCAKCQTRIASERLVDEDELQSYFIRRIEKYLNKNGRTIIGWDEILEGGVAPNAVVMSWRGIEGGIHAAQMNHQVIMTPNESLYFDYYQSKSSLEPLAIGGYLPLQLVYDYEPIPAALTAQEAKNIMGVQANVWTEYMPTSEQVEYMVCPRLMALAETAWCKPEQKKYEDFLARLTGNLAHLRAKNVSYADF